MSGKKKTRRSLTPAERALWEKVVAHAAPMRQAAEPPTTADTPPARPIPPKPAHSITYFRIGQASPAPQQRRDLVPSLEESFALSGGNKTPAMDRKRFEKLKRGKLAIDARLDLHGMTQARAQAALSIFVRDSHASGKRLLLVITGKGRDGDNDDIMPTPRGILKHQVPRWLAQPPLAPLILQVNQAHRRHGGAGAYYVYLRRRRVG